MSALMTLGAVLSGAYAPGRVSQGRVVLGEGSDKERFKRPFNEEKDREPVYPARRDTGAPPWSQAWGWGPWTSAWWPGLRPWGPAGPSPNRLRGHIPQRTHHPQGEPGGSGVVWIGQTKAGALAVRSPATEAGCWDVERHLSGGEGAGVGGRGGAIPARYSRPHLDT